MNVICTRLNSDKLVKNELQYINLVTFLLDKYDSGYNKKLCSNDGSGSKENINTISTFGYMMRFDLSVSFPILTTKKLFIRGILEELLWFIRGSSNNQELIDRNVNIWTANANKNGIECNDLGPIYGVQWRRCKGVKYKTDEIIIVDQLQNVIDQIRNNPYSRRIVLSSWNVAQIDEMALPPCHITCQFYVNDGKLSAMLNQRSGDIGLGIPFNIASYSFLVHMIAKITKLEVGDFIHVIGDAHIYENHIDGLRLQVSRDIRNGPILEIVDRGQKEIDDFVISDFIIDGYDPHPSISMKMSC